MMEIATGTADGGTCGSRTAQGIGDGTMTIGQGTDAGADFAGFWESPLVFRDHDMKLFPI